MIINTTNNEVISKKERVCRTFLSQLRGLMFRKKQNLIMIFNEERKISLHNFFVFYPIDVFLLNKNTEVVEIKRNFKPFTIQRFAPKAKYVIETPRLNVEIKIKDKISVDDLFPVDSKLHVSYP